MIPTRVSNANDAIAGMTPACQTCFMSSISRRDFVRTGSMLATAAVTGSLPEQVTGQEARTKASKVRTGTQPHPFLTPASEFRDVSRGNPKPHTLRGEALVQARLTPDTWRLEIIADTTPADGIKETAGLSRPLTVENGTALDLSALLEVGKRHEVKFIKAMQCLNIPTPLGQGLWEGVPLREVLRLCGAMRNVRRVHYWGFHNNDPKQVFRSSLSYAQAMETPPGELPVFLAYRLNGEPIPLARGGPVRMLVPWAYGFKSIKWLQRITVTNDYRANDTYAEANNDPESPLKSAAYLDAVPGTVPAGQPVPIGGLVMSGLSGVKRVEYALTRHADDAPTLWNEAHIEPAPEDWSGMLPAGVRSHDLLGFDRATGQPLTWPLRYSTVSWSAMLRGLPKGRHAVHVRAVDLNGFAQPEPRPIQKAGKNALDVKEFEVV